MRKTFEKIAIIAHAAISFVFVLLTVLILFNVLPLEYVEERVSVDSIVLVLIAVLAVFYAGLTAYLVYCAFNQTQLLKYVKLYSDANTKVMATSKTVKRMVEDNAKRLGSVKINKIKISSDGRNGLMLRVNVQVSCEEVSMTLDTLRCMCQDTFNKVLGLSFTSIDFKIEKIAGKYQADVETAKKQAQTLEAERKYAREVYLDPLCEKCGEMEENQPTEQPVQEKSQPTETAEQVDATEETQPSEEQTEESKD